MAVTTGALVLLVGFGSKTGLPPVAMFVTVPRAVEMTVRVRFVVAPAARLPRLVQMTWLLALVVVTGTELTKTNPAGKLSVTEIPVAADGPKFVTEIV